MSSYLPTPSSAELVRLASLADWPPPDLHYRLLLDQPSPATSAAVAGVDNLHQDETCFAGICFHYLTFFTIFGIVIAVGSGCNCLLRPKLRCVFLHFATSHTQQAATPLNINPLVTASYVYSNRQYYNNTVAVHVRCSHSWLLVGCGSLQNEEDASQLWSQQTVAATGYYYPEDGEESKIMKTDARETGFILVQVIYSSNSSRCCWRRLVKEKTIMQIRRYLWPICK